MSCSTGLSFVRIWLIDNQHEDYAEINMVIYSYDMK
jgi:hypothetical protein